MSRETILHGGKVSCDVDGCGAFYLSYSQVSFVRGQAVEFGGWRRVQLNTMPDWKALELGSDGRRKLDVCPPCAAEAAYEHAMYVADAPRRRAAAMASARAAAQARETERIRQRDERRAVKRAERDARREAKRASKRMATATAAGVTVAVLEARRIARAARKIPVAAENLTPPRASAVRAGGSDHAAPS